MAKLKPFTQHKPCPMKQSPSLPEVLTNASYKAFFYHSYAPLLFSPAGKMQHPHITHCEAMDFGPIPSLWSTTILPQTATPVLISKSILAWESDVDCGFREPRQGKSWAEKEMARTDSRTNIQTNFFVGIPHSNRAWDISGTIDLVSGPST
jgi:hypothetical protein